MQNSDQKPLGREKYQQPLTRYDTNFLLPTRTISTDELQSAKELGAFLANEFYDNLVKGLKDNFKHTGDLYRLTNSITSFNQLSEEAKHKLKPVYYYRKKLGDDNIFRQYSTWMKLGFIQEFKMNFVFDEARNPAPLANTVIDKYLSLENTLELAEA